MKTMLKIAALTVLVGAAGSASAIGVLSTTGTGAPGNCQGALPVYDGLIRKRPLAIVNEGTSSTFVTCSLSSQEVSLNVQSFFTRVSNQGTDPATVTCTSVVGDEMTANNRYITKTATVAPGEIATITWTGADVAGGLLLSKSIAFQCFLPPGTGLNRNSITTLLSLI